MTSPILLSRSPHFASSRWIIAAYSSGVLGIGSPPSDTMRLLISSERDDRAHFLVDAIDDRTRRAGGRSDRVIEHRLEARQPASAAVGTSGNAAERFGDATAIALIFPAWILPSAGAIVLKASVTWPPTRSLVSGPVPL